MGGVTVFGLPPGLPIWVDVAGDGARADRARWRVALVEGHRSAVDPARAARGRGRRGPRQRAAPAGMTAPRVRIRPVEDDDLPIFLAHQEDPVAAAMASFPTRTPDVFYEHWAKIRADPMNYHASDRGRWRSRRRHPQLARRRRSRGRLLDRPHPLGQGVRDGRPATLLARIDQRPITAHIALDNIGSQRVVEHCGFVRIGEEVADDGVRRGDVPPRGVTVRAPVGRLPYRCAS